MARQKEPAKHPTTDEAAASVTGTQTDNKQIFRFKVRDESFLHRTGKQVSLLQQSDHAHLMTVGGLGLVLLTK